MKTSKIKVKTMKRTSVILAILLFTVIFAGAINAQEKDDSNKVETKIEKQEYDQNVKIKKKLRVGAARSYSQSSGVARLRVTFDKSAKVTNVETISSSGCDEFDRNALSAAKKIKFEPAMKNGEPVTVTKLVEYVFTIYIK